MITFVGEENKKTYQVTGVATNSQIGSMKLTPTWHGWIRDRLWLWFPLVVEPECFGKTLPAEWRTHYPRIIQWSDGKYYVFRGTNSSNEEYGIKGENVVFYREILVDTGEKIEYI